MTNSKKKGGETAHRRRGEFYRVMGGHRIKHNGLGFDARPRKVVAPPTRFNSGPTPRDAVLDFVALIAEYPEAWDHV